MITKILFLITLIAVNAFFAASEIALISLNDNKIKQMADKGDKKAKQLTQLLSEPSRFLATIQVGITLAGFLASAFAAESFSEPLVTALKGLNVPLPDSVLKVGMVVLITIILAYFTLVLGELVPKRIAMKKPEGIAFTVVSVLVFLSKVTSPFVRFLTASTNFFVNMFGIDPQTEDDNVTEEEIRMLIDVGEEKGTIATHEKIMINNVFEFNNKTAEDIMTHRMELVAIPLNIDLDTLVALIAREQFSRIPVYDKSIDNVIGVLHIKDMIKLITVSSDHNFNLEPYIRKALYVPMHKMVNELFLNFQETKTHIGIVIDDYGGTAGIVTIEDLIEEIVGNIFDEHDKEEDIEIKQIDTSTYEVRGTISLYELEKHFEVEFPVETYETLNGFLIDLFGHMPSKDQINEINYKNLFIRTVKVTDKRIEKVIIKKTV
ncbi:hemolysin family protein [Fusibacter bizertensis]|uniref:Hemolysin family protein n=1 Tax=Fusibacter bizertensis TaxID=1488331 RepID=A0ABT6NG10_9FIRM|nr:hemolysin family protein [Fusibacter bizertensis]MDH8679365.1 hemolysin family protein [Fusibacter bizertensis]